MERGSVNDLNRFFFYYLSKSQRSKSIFMCFYEYNIMNHQILLNGQKYYLKLLMSVNTSLKTYNS